MVPWEREEGQAPAPPLVGAMLALLHGWLTQAAEEVEPSGLVLPVGQSSQPVRTILPYFPAAHGVSI